MYINLQKFKPIKLDTKTIISLIYKSNFIDTEDENTTDKNITPDESIIVTNINIPSAMYENSENSEITA